jgi:hypothetical protein
MQIQSDVTRPVTQSAVPAADAETTSTYREVVEKLYDAGPKAPAVSSAEVEAFREALTSKGALRFYIDFNLEKIEKLVEAYRDELEAYAKEHPDETIDIEGMVTAYRKQLMEQFMNDDEEKAGMLNPNRAVSELLPDAMQQPEGSLEALMRQQADDDAKTVLI